MDDSDHHGYNLLLKAFGNTRYTQTEYWGTHRDFKLDPVLSNPEYKEITIPSVADTL
jgi:hypothetical protein